MSVKKPSSSKKNPQNSDKIWKRIYLTALIGVPLVLLVLFPLWFNLFVRQDIRIPEITEKMTHHLETKYDRSFTVTKAHYINFGLGMTGIWQAEAHPKDDNGLIFEVGSSNDTTAFTDEYPGAFWEQQAHEYVKPLITKTFGYTPEYSVRVVTYGSKTSTIEGQLPDFSKALTLHGPQIGLILTATSLEKVDTSNKLIVAKRTYEVVEEVKKLGVSYASMDYKGATGGGLKFSRGGHSETSPPIHVEKAEDLTSIVKEGK